MSANKFAVVWGFSSEVMVGVLSTHATRKEAEIAVVLAEDSNDNPSCGYWIEVECDRCCQYGSQCSC